MKRLLLNCFAFTIAFIACTQLSIAQTTVATGLTGGSSAAATGVNVLGVTNTNTYAIAITTFSIYHNTGTNNGRTYTVWYHPTALTGAPSVTAANGWIQVATSPTISITTSAVTPVLTNQYLVIPPNTTYRIAIVCNSGLSYFSTTGVNTYSSGGVTIQTGSSTVSPGYAGTMPSPTLTPRYFAGSITFVPATPKNVTAVTLVSPVASPAYCSYDSALVRVVLRNVGDSAQSNFPVTARYVGTSVNTITANYTNTLAPFTSDTFTIGKLNLAQGTYTVRAFTQLSTDTVKSNDTTPSVSFTFRKPLTPPIVVSDTVCPGGSTSISVTGVNNTTYRWYSAQTGGSLLNIGTSLTFTNVTQDTVMWVAADSLNCLSNRVPIGVFVQPPPAPDLGPDTAFCATHPLLLDAGHPGATYLWSTGDTTQTILITSLSGTYTVAVTKFCTRYDTINVTVRPLPQVTGISYVRMNNTYYFQPSFYQDAESFMWYFGDGTTSTDTTPIHTYSQSINVALTVMLVVKNVCGEDTVYKTIPTGLNDPDNYAGVNIYPNPATEKLFLHSENGVKLKEVAIYNTLGQLVFRQQLSKTADEEIDIRHLPGGNYILRLQTDKGVLSRPIQVSH